VEVRAWKRRARSKIQLCPSLSDMGPTRGSLAGTGWGVRVLFDRRDLGFEQMLVAACLLNRAQRAFPGQGANAGIVSVSAICFFSISGLSAQI